jgi:GTP-binding protein EngB required for normal cell division
MIAERLESHRFEIAVFGRVSSGKSSLLNHILRTAVLPVGVNPITAVPTRLIHGPEAVLTVSYADRRTERLAIGCLPEFASEVNNPTNVKGVVRLVVELPSERLKSGLGFVDTPGLGSLAAAGAAETLAYLPQCDLGVVLIAAGTPLNHEDLATIRLLYEAAIPVKVLLSKADLLVPADLESALAYTAGEMRTELGVKIDVHPISTAASHAQLVEQWFAGELAPLYEKHQELAQESIRGKSGALREAVEAALQAQLNGATAGQTLQKEDLLTLERELREAAGKLEDARGILLACIRRDTQPDGVGAGCGGECSAEGVGRRRKGSRCGRGGRRRDRRDGRDRGTSSGLSSRPGPHFDLGIANDGRHTGPARCASGGGTPAPAAGNTALRSAADPPEFPPAVAAASARAGAKVDPRKTPAGSRTAAVYGVLDIPADGRELGPQSAGGTPIGVR